MYSTGLSPIIRWWIGVYLCKFYSIILVERCQLREVQTLDIVTILPCFIGGPSNVTFTYNY